MQNLRLLLALAVLPALAARHDDELAKDAPVAVWNFPTTTDAKIFHGGAKLGADGSGPSGSSYPDHSPQNHALILSQPGASVRVPDDGRLTFKKGDPITLEAWVQLDAIGQGQNIYIIGKGRTGRAGYPPHNQNWGLRLREIDGTARISFVFRDERDATTPGDAHWHRWFSHAGFVAGPEWHHVAITYTFGQPDSLRGFLDGSEVGGAWDMGGPTELGPWADDDEVWLGSSMGGSAAASFRGRLDAVAVHRRTVEPARLKARFNYVPPPPAVAPADLPKGKVLVEVLEHPAAPGRSEADDWTPSDAEEKKAAAGFERSWANPPREKTDAWTEPAFGLAALTQRYSPQGIRVDRSIPHLVRMSAVVTLPPGGHRLIIRTLQGGRLSLDGKAIATTAMTFKPSGPQVASDAEPPPDMLARQIAKDAALLPPGHSEAEAVVTGDGQTHIVAFEFFVGGRNLRPEFGQPSVSVSHDGRPFRLLAPDGDGPEFTDAGWKTYVQAQAERIAALNAVRRRHDAEEAYWQRRHDLARAEIAKKPAVPGKSIDEFIAAKIAQTKATPSSLLGDAAFLRRVTLDTIGLAPTPEEVAAFLADRAPDKRAKTIDRLLADSRWADQWVPYWQDVLAENPAILKATLNNTGPFRWFLHEALRDNWAMDRFATALITMEGSPHHGGAAGFALASQNDLPMAAKAQILSSAFLGMEMKCARCHDAPNHPFDQRELFALSAMLRREAIKVPESSLTKGLSPDSHVTVSLKAGQKIDPHFPFANFATDPLPGVLRRADDSRERLAAILTDPRNERFAQVLVNRLWKQLLGWGIVDPVDDWDAGRPSHPELLAWLGRELITHDYDLKHAARLILNSAAYQRTPTDEGSRFAKPDARTFAAPARRRLTAEQVVDTLFQIAGKDFDCEPMNFDLDARRSIKDFNNLGVPRRAWEFCGLSNERDRPALGKPAAQTITDVLANFGWRDSRAEPRSTRDHEANVIQPAILANGVMGARITRVSDDSAFAALALREQPVEALVGQLFIRVLNRAPDAGELRIFADALRSGYAERIAAAPTGEAPSRPRITQSVAWTNHLHPEATSVIYAHEAAVRAGDPPTARLHAAWRERLEDVLWALMLTPEFIHLP